MAKTDMLVETSSSQEKPGESIVDMKGQADAADKYKSESDEKVTLGHYFRIFTYASKLDLVMLPIAIVASIGAGVTLPIMNIVFGKLVGDLTSFATDGSGITSDTITDLVSKLTLYIVYLFIGKFTLTYIAMFSLRIVGIRISAAIRLHYLRALFAQSVSDLDKLPPGKPADTITGAANLLQIGISEKLGTFFHFTALLVSAYIIAFIHSWKLTLVTSSVLLFVILIYTVEIPIMIKLMKSKEHADSKATSIASETFGSIRMVAACGAEKRVAARFSGWIEEARRRGLKISPVLGFQFSPIFLALFADFGLSFWFGVRLKIWGEIDSDGTVLIVVMSVMMSVMSMANIVVPITSITKAAGAACSFFALIDAPTVNAGGLRDPEVSTQSDIVFKDVVFAYPTRPKTKVLDGLNVTFEKGKLTAIVGPSGSGKSTVVGLIERWYELSKLATKDAVDNATAATSTESVAEKITDDPEEPVAISGSISIDGHNIEELDLKWWRSQIGLVQQEPFVFNDTIFNNILHGLTGSKFENEDDATKKQLVEEACKEAFADEFIDRLPLKYETLVGEGGIKLSGGQRQRLAIARSIIKRPQILIFDEATSAIDVRSERIVQAALDRVAKNRTTITIAHRLSTIKKADKIVVVSKGKLVEQGTHEELITAKGVYHGLVYAQQLSMSNVEDAAEGEEAELALSTTLSRHDTEKKTESIAEEIKEVYKPKGFFGSFGFLMVEQKAHLIWLILTFIGATGAGCAQPTQSYLFAEVISIFTITTEAELIAGSEYWALRFVYLAIGVSVAYFIIGWASNSYATHVSCSYRQEYFESIAQKPISFFDQDENSSGTLVSRVSSDTTQLQEMMGTNMAMLLVAIFTMVGCMVLGFVFGWKLTLVSTFSTIPIILIGSYYRISYEIQFEKMNSAVFAESSKFASEAIGAFRTVTSMTLEDVICERYAKLLKDHVDKAAKKSRLTTLVFALSDSVALPCMALTFWYGGKLMSTGEYNLVQFLVIYIAVIAGSESAGQSASFGPNMAQASAAANRILSFRNKPVVHQAPKQVPEGLGGADIELKSVHFTYPTRDIPIFCGLNLSIKNGQFAALVGASGCGKTSIVSILEQFYPIQKGSVLLDGVNINDLDIAEYRKVFSLVAQEPTLFQGSIRDNILLGVDENSVSEEDITRSCSDAEIHDFIMSLPEGYNTDIGSKGIALSGGQKQRIAIARALIRRPRVLLLDEATSSLDSESEKLVQAAFERAGKGRTMVVVAHRLATVQNADIIFVLGSVAEGGTQGARVLEKGTHTELVARRGVYYQMCQSQALDR